MLPCTEKCWTAVPCPECGNDLPPRGRSVPLGMHVGSCCERYTYTDINKRHLWHEVDEERWRFDPEGEARFNEEMGEPLGDVLP